LGTYQGQVSKVNEREQTITLIQAFQNGIPISLPDITISACDIKDLKILNLDELRKQQEAASAQANGGERLHNGNVPSGRSNYSPSVIMSPQKDADARRRGNSEQKKRVVTPKKIDPRRRQQSEKDEACFNAPIDNFILENEFDFEKNLALFDKQAVFEEIESTNNKPDVVRLVDCNRRAPQPKYRCDENVIHQDPVKYRQIAVPSPGTREYVTDAGLVVPSISCELRSKLFSVAGRRGLSTERQTEQVGRAAAEMLLQLLGGSHRLNPHNTHQRPFVIILAGCHIQGAQAVNCGRHLSNHGVHVVVFQPRTDAQLPPWLENELALFKLSQGKLINVVQELPNTPVDIVLNALDDHNTFLLSRAQPWYSFIVQWIGQRRAQVVSLDPPPSGVLVPTKWSLLPALPLSMDDSCGAVYLCDVGIPKQVFQDVGISYSSPFGPKFFIPLHPADEFGR